MKASQRVIKKGDYYELQTIEDLMMQQRMPKKQQIQNPTTTTNINQYIVTQLPSRDDALKNYTFAISGKIKTDDYGLDDYQNSLEELLKLPIKDQERLEIQKLLKQISSIKNTQQLPLNSLPQPKKVQNPKQAPKVIDLVGNYNIKKLEENIKSLEDIKYIQLTRLQNIVEILLSQNKQVQEKSQQSTQIDPKIKQQIETLYNNLSQLTCLNNLTGTVNKIASNEAKFVEINNWVQKTQQINKVNKQILDQFDNDQLMLNQLQQSFKKNIQAVKGVVKKLSE